MTGILWATAIVGGAGLFIGILLGIAGEKFKVEVDEKEAEVREALPGANCGGCGYVGCDALAAAIAAGEAEVNACPVGGAAAAEKIGAIMGKNAEIVRKVAFVKCGGDCNAAKEKYQYTGNMNCMEAANTTGGGKKTCTYGCLGLGSCVAVCSFNALRIEDGIAKVDREACVACGKCVDICPKHLIELIPYEAKHFVMCNSADKGKDVMAACSAGCIGCKICEKNCPEGAITVTNNVAKIDYEKCTGCGICVSKCPKKTIH
ncbi:MAG: 4Fe-4S dicluster domain-containing protein [Lachnospiraceae bacterium]|nr:4Fe-4S dicluster domain-containing protein [Lachnospiraceae bacterium]